VSMRKRKGRRSVVKFESGSHARARTTNQSLAGENCGFWLVLALEFYFLVAFFGTRAAGYGIACAWLLMAGIFAVDLVAPRLDSALARRKP